MVNEVKFSGLTIGAERNVRHICWSEVTSSDNSILLLLETRNSLSQGGTVAQLTVTIMISSL